MKFNTFGAPAFGVFASSFSLGGVDSLPISLPAITYAAEVSSIPTVAARVENERNVVEVNSAAETLRSPKVSTWDEETKAQFSSLSKRFALQTITSEEMVQFERLKELRRQEAPSRTFAEIRADIEFHRAVESAIAAIQRLMSHDTESQPSHRKA